MVWVKPIPERARSVGGHSGSELNGILVVVDVESEGRGVDAELVCKISSFLFSSGRTGCVSSPFSGLFFLSLVFILLTGKSS